MDRKKIEKKIMLRIRCTARRYLGYCFVDKQPKNKISNFFLFVI